MRTSCSYTTCWGVAASAPSTTARSESPSAAPAVHACCVYTRIASSWWNTLIHCCCGALCRCRVPADALLLRLFLASSLQGGSNSSMWQCIAAIVALCKGGTCMLSQLQAAAIQAMHLVAQPVSSCVCRQVAGAGGGHQDGGV